MFLKQLDNLIRNINLAVTIEPHERRSGEDRRQGHDRRSEARYGEGSERRVTPDRRQASTIPVSRLWYEELSKRK